MKQFILLLITLAVYESAYAESWDISEIYHAKEVPYKSKALDSYGVPVTSYGSISTIQKLLIPYTIENGEYNVTIIEITPTFFQVKNTDYYLDMKGRNYLGPTSVIKKAADVTLIKDGFIQKITYKQ